MAEEGGPAAIPGAFWEHLGVLRRYLLAGVLVFIALACVFFFYGNDTVIAYLLQPLHGEQLVFLSPLGPFFFKIKVALYLAFFVSFPIWFGLVFAFVAPALSSARRLILAGFGLAILVLGIASIVFTYLFFIPKSLAVLQGFTVPGTSLFLTADSYFSFSLLELAVSFVILQLPVVIVALSAARVLDPALLARNRRILYLALVALLAILTPTTDAFTLTIVSVPAILLTELGIAISRIIYNRYNEERLAV